jgi:hypothetical protein
MMEGRGKYAGKKHKADKELAPVEQAGGGRRPGESGAAARGEKPQGTQAGMGSNFYIFAWTWSRTCTFMLVV